ncbi:FGGY-family carbohydrate kinase, partial [bacterium]|nr:FGGY-family carbohydrate kinase [bacterium]
ELMAWVGLKSEQLPELTPSLSHYGDILADGQSIPLSLLNGDQSAAAFAFGQLNSDRLYINMGTGAFIYTPLDHVPNNLNGLLCSVVLSKKGGRELVLEGTVNGAASALQAYSKQHKLRRYVNILEKHLGEQCPIYLNGVGGLASPDWRSQFGSSLHGEGTVKQGLLAVAESILFLLFRNYQAMLQTLDGRQLTEIVISGGLANIDAVCQALADVFSLPVLRYPEVEASSLGAAYCLAGQPDTWLKSIEAQRFNPLPNELLRARYQRWERLMNEKLTSS